MLKQRRKKYCKKQNKLKKTLKSAFLFLIFIDFISDYDIILNVRSNKGKSRS